MVLRHQSLLQEGQCVILQLAGSVIGGRRTLTRSSDVSTVSLCEESTKGPSITESFEDSNVGTRGRAEAGFEDILEDHLVDMMAAGQPKQASSEFLLNPNASTLHHASVPKPGCETEGDDLVPDARSSPSFKTTAATFCQSNPSLPGPPRRNSASSSPVRRTARRSIRIAREGREEFSVPMQDQPLRYLLVPQFHDLLGGLLSPAIRARWTVLFGPPYSQCPFQELER
ncbi:hypothetical protein GWK47_043358 [Chionoecetes opilio]|uniref:Uncharacterized protein n=1 Tax=Chionoecetes opilio TaxID=41210 RepID=A0A8J4YH17_CHIOP|nr:hypothetical protein GWK47_043358 [Chionoecetes opilio]